VNTVNTAAPSATLFVFVRLVTRTIRLDVGDAI